MGDEDDQHWKFVRGRNRIKNGDRSHLPDIATTTNWRKGNFENLTAYFFMDFPNGAKAMFNAFNYYGNIVEVVIPSKRDTGG
jgi:hypothetical protein